jgi:hypothetical protein
MSLLGQSIDCLTVRVNHRRLPEPFKLRGVVGLIAFLAVVVVCFSTDCTLFAQDQAQDAADLKTQEMVLQLVNELADPAVDKRDTAQRRLVALGTVALPIVKSVYEEQRLKGDAETRLAGVFQNLQEMEMKDFLREHTVTLSGSYSLPTVLQKIGELTGNEVAMTPVNEGDVRREDLNKVDKKVIVDFQNEPFWKAIDRLCDENDLTVFPYGNSKGVELKHGKSFGLGRMQRGQYSGPFRLEVVSTNATRSFSSPVLNALRITTQIAWEPRLNPLLFLVDNKSILGECDDGAILESVDEHQIEVSPNLPAQAEFDLALKLPPRSSKTIVRLTGKLVAAIPSAPVTVKFKNLDSKSPNERKVGSITASIEDARVNGDLIQVNLLLKLGDSGIRLDSFRNWLMVNEARAYDGAGKTVNNLGWQTYLMNEKEVGITINFENKGKLSDFQFEFSAPAALIDHPIEFVLDDIYLP